MAHTSVRDNEYPYGKSFRAVAGGVLGKYSVLHGSFANVGYKIGPGGYIEDFFRWKRHLMARSPIPLPDKERTFHVDVVDENPEKSIPNESEVKEDIVYSEEAYLAREYSVSGWFKWNPTNV